jgi:glyoxylase-like metal-dependent hydrolase (beta-lactamase superfamily II)
MPGIRRLTAANAGPMTYHGTNTFLLDEPDGIVVVDPGPEDHAHVDAIVAAAGGRIVRILLTHAHVDHVGALKELQRRTGVPVASFHRSASPDHQPDIVLYDGSRIGSLVAVHTPGHAPDHLCFSRSDGLLFTGDHVMAWCSSVVPPPPRGDMTAFFASLQRLIDRDDRLYLPGHGPALANPRPYVQNLLERRMAREQEIEDAIRGGLSSPLAIAATLYRKSNPVLQRAAERNVLSHLSKLVGEGRVREISGENYVAD